MLTVAYLANQYPSPAESYVGDEIAELRRRGVEVIAGSVRQPDSQPAGIRADVVFLQPLRLSKLLHAAWFAGVHQRRIRELLKRLLRGKENLLLRIKALLHTWLGAYYALILQDRGVDHIHVHHGYFGSWIAMAAAQLLDIPFSMTLHGSDLLVHGTYLDTKLEHCRFCITISEYNRRHIVERFPQIDPGKIIVCRLGVDVSDRGCFKGDRETLASSERLTLLAVGRLHPVKDHAFLLRACACLRNQGIDFECLIAGEGPERSHLEALIREGSLEQTVTMLGAIPRQQMDSLYSRADLVVLTSRSEGIPLVLMEAMARAKIVLAPAITGIPELVIPGTTGFLYEPGWLDDFVARIIYLLALMRSSDPALRKRLDWIRHAARLQVLHNFHRQTNLACFCDHFLELAGTRPWSRHENPVLQ